MLETADSIERSVIRKVTLRLIPFIAFLYVICYLDRINVGFAALSMNEDLKFSDAVYGFGAGIFFIGYFIFQVPSNLMFERIGVRKWITPIAIIWGCLSSAMMFVTNAHTFFVLRFILGIAEAGFFPGMLLYLTYWFPHKERAKAVSMFMLGLPLSVVIGGPLSGILLNLDGKFGLAGWQWLFMIEGIPAVLLGFFVMHVLPEKPKDAKWLLPEEKEWLNATLKAEHEEKLAGKEDIKSQRHGLKMALGNKLVWFLATTHILITTGQYGLTLWIPEMIKSFSGYSNYVTSMLTALPYIAAAVGMYLIGSNSDKTGERKFHVGFSAFLGAFGLIACAISESPVIDLISLTISAIGIIGTLGPFWAIPPTYLTGTSAAVGIAVINCFGNLGGFLGPYLVGIGKNITHSFVGGLLILAVMLVTGGTMVINLKHGTPTLPTSEVALLKKG